MDLNSYLSDVLGFEHRLGKDSTIPQLSNFLPYGHYDEFVRGRWHILVLNHIRQEGVPKIGVRIVMRKHEQDQVSTYTDYTVFLGFINREDSLQEFKGILKSCSNILEQNEDIYKCERITLSSSSASLGSSGFISKYYLWHFDDLLASDVPSGYNVLIPDSLNEDDCIGFINNYLTSYGRNWKSEIITDDIPHFPKSYIDHFNHVGVNVIDVDSRGKMYITRNKVKEPKLGLERVESIFVIRVALKAIVEDRVDEAKLLLTDIGLVRDIVIGCTLHGHVRIAYMSQRFGSIEVEGEKDDLVRYIEIVYGSL